MAAGLDDIRTQRFLGRGEFKDYTIFSTCSLRRFNWTLLKLNVLQLNALQLNANTTGPHYSRALLQLDFIITSRRYNWTVGVKTE